MISFITPEEQFPRPSLTPGEELNTPLTDAANAYLKAHMEFVDTELRKALTEMFGAMPPDEEIMRCCKCVVGSDNESHYIWTNGEPLKVGDPIDLSKAFLVIPPPKIFNPEHLN